MLSTSHLYLTMTGFSGTKKKPKIKQHKSGLFPRCTWIREHSLHPLCRVIVKDRHFFFTLRTRAPNDQRRFVMYF